MSAEPDRKAPYDTPFGRAAFMGALAAARGAPTSLERVQAAYTAYLLDTAVSPVALDERLATDILEVIAFRLTDAVVVDFLLRVLRRRAPDLGKLAGGLERLAARAHREQLQESLSCLVSAILSTPAWRSCARPEWAGDALALDVSNGAGELPARGSKIAEVRDRGSGGTWAWEAEMTVQPPSGSLE